MYSKGQKILFFIKKNTIEYYKKKTNVEFYDIKIGTQNENNILLAMTEATIKCFLYYKSNFQGRINASTFPTPRMSSQTLLL